MVDLTEITLENVNDGAAVQLFQRKLQEVLENILDPNTDPEKKRRVRIDVDIKPAESRSEGSVTVSAKAKLAPVESDARTMHIGKREDGRLAAAHYDPEQLTFGQDPEDEDGVHPLDERRQG